MPIADVLNLSIAVSGAGPSRAGFGEPMIAAYNLPFSDMTREYSTLAGMIADGFTVNHPAYVAASKIKAQNPAPPFFKVGKRALAYTQTLKLQLLSTSASDVYKISLNLPGNSPIAVVVAPSTVGMASTGVPTVDVATLNTAVTALAITGLTATHATDTLTLTMAAGALLDVQPGPSTLVAFSDTTANPGVATDLAAILAADSNWYGLVLDSNSKAEITAAAAWVEGTAGKIFVYNNSDTANMNPASTTDIFYLEKGLSHARSAGMMSQTQLLCYAGAAWMGKLFPTDPGSENWAFKTLSGVPVDNLSDTQIHAVENKNASVYTSIFSLNLTQFGKQPSGQWIDVTRGVDALTNDMQVRIVALQANSKKIPFTDAGIAQYQSALIASLTTFVQSGFLAANPAPFVFVPLAANVDSINKAARNLPLVSFSATIAGAINSAVVQGVLTT